MHRKQYCRVLLCFFEAHISTAAKMAQAFRARSQDTHARIITILWQSLHNPYSTLDFLTSPAACQSKWFIDGRCARVVHHSRPHPPPGPWSYVNPALFTVNLNVREYNCQNVSVNALIYHFVLSLSRIKGQTFTPDVSNAVPIGGLEA